MMKRSVLVFTAIIFSFIETLAEEQYTVYVNDSSSEVAGNCGHKNRPCPDITSALQNISTWKYTESSSVWIEIQRLDQCNSVDIVKALADATTHLPNVTRRFIGFRGGREGNATDGPIRPICINGTENWLLLHGCTSWFDLYFKDMMIMKGAILNMKCPQTRLNIKNVTIQTGSISIFNGENNATSISNTVLKASARIEISGGSVDFSGFKASSLEYMNLLWLAESDLIHGSARFVNTQIFGGSVNFTGNVSELTMSNNTFSNVSFFEFSMNFSEWKDQMHTYSNGLWLENTKIYATSSVFKTNPAPLNLKNLDFIAESGSVDLKYRGAVMWSRSSRYNGMVSNITNCQFGSPGPNWKFKLEGYSTSEEELIIHNLTLSNITAEMLLQGQQVYIDGLQVGVLDEKPDLAMEVNTALLTIDKSNIKEGVITGIADTLSISNSKLSGNLSLSSSGDSGPKVTLRHSTIDFKSFDVDAQQLAIYTCQFPREVHFKTDVLYLRNSTITGGGSVVGERVSICETSWVGDSSENQILSIQLKQAEKNSTTWANLTNISITNMDLLVSGFDNTYLSGKLESLERAEFDLRDLTGLDLILSNISKWISFNKVSPALHGGKMVLSHVKNLTFNGPLDLEAIAPIVQPELNLTTLKQNGSILESSEVLSTNGTYKGGKLAGFILENATSITLKVWVSGKAPFENSAFKYWGYLICGASFLLVGGLALCYCKCCKDERRYSNHEVRPGYRSMNTANAQNSGSMGPRR